MPAPLFFKRVIRDYLAEFSDAKDEFSDSEEEEEDSEG